MTPSKLPRVFLVRHGETEWSLSGQHTGNTDIALTARGEENARRVTSRLAGTKFTRVWSSPLVRARRTAELAGFGEQMELDADLKEWNYGDYEGRTTLDIQKADPDWNIFRDGAPSGESAADVGGRVDRVIKKILGESGDLILFAHGHVLRVFGARWLQLPPASGSLFYLNTASLSIVAFEHSKLDEPVIRLWNDDSHVS